MGKNVLYTNAELRSLIVPLFFSTLLFISVGAADSMMVASLGAESVSGVALVDMVNLLLGGMLAALSTGGAVVASQYLGAGRPKDGNDSAKQLLFISELFSIALSLLCIFGKRFILHLFFGNIPEGVEAEAMRYFRVTSYMFPFMGISFAAAAILRSIDKARSTLISSIIVNIINIAGNYLCIFVFKWGVTGAAISTILSRIAACVYLFAVLSDRGNKIYVSLHEHFSVNLAKIKKILFIGIPSGFETGIFTLGRLLVVGIVTKFGTQELAANSVANSISSIGCIMGNTFCLAMIPVIGRAVGTGNMDTVRAYVWKMSKWAWSSYAIWNVCVYALLPFILGFYTKLTPETKHLVLVLCSIHLLFGILGWSLSFTFPCALRAMNDVKFTMCVSVGSMIIVRIGLAYYFGQYLGWGAIGTWIAMVCDWVVRISFFLGRYKSGAWQKYALSALK